MNHLGDAVHYVRAAQYRSPVTHDLRDRLAIARRFQNLRRKNRDRLRIVQLQAARLTLACNLRSHEDQKFFLLARRKLHGASFMKLVNLSWPDGLLAQK